MGRVWFYMYYPLMEVKKKMLSTKYLAAVIVLTFINVLQVVTLRRFSSMVGYSATPWIFPFMISAGFYSLLYFALYIYFYSDAPFVQAHTMYQMIRCGRIKWGILQIENIIFSSFVFNGVGFLISAAVMFPYISLESGWGKVIYTLARTDAGRNYNISIFIPYDILRKYTPLQFLCLTLLILWLAGSFMGLMMFAVSLWLGQTAALVFSSVLVVLPIIMDDFVSAWRPYMMHLSPLSWTRMTEIGQYRYGIPLQPTITYILGTYIILCILCSAAALVKLKNVDLKWSNEE